MVVVLLFDNVGWKSTFTHVVVVVVVVVIVCHYCLSCVAWYVEL